MEPKDAPPLNQDIISDHSGNDILADQDLRDAIPDADKQFNILPPGCDPNALNPRNYTYIPS